MEFVTSDLSTDDELLARYRNADYDGFDRFYRRNRVLIFQFLLSRLANRADAEEAFQETFLRIHRSILTYDPRQRALPWVITIAKNVARDFRTRRREHIELRENDSVAPATAETSISARQELGRMLAKMSIDDRSLLERRLMDDEDFDSIARDAKTSNASVRQRFSRLLKKLRQSD